MTLSICAMETLGFGVSEAVLRERRVKSKVGRMMGGFSGEKLLFCESFTILNFLMGPKATVRATRRVWEEYDVEITVYVGYFG